MQKRIFILMWFALAPILSWAQDITFQSQAEKTEVSVNERFVVEFVLTYGQENLRVDKPLVLPDFGKLQQLGESQINSFQFINGQVINQTGVEVLLVADREGEYTIAPATVTISGKQYKTQPIKITVKKGLKQEVPGGQRMQGAFLTAEISNENPYVNQESILVVKVFARDYSILNRLRNFQEPDFHDLSAKYVSEKIPNSEKQVLYNGVTFISKEIARYVIFPQQSGEISIDPFSVDVLVSGYYGSETVSLTSPVLKMNVKNLPENKPKNFSGAVGHYTMNTTVSRKELKANESVNLEVEIVGSGNLNTMQMPSVEVPEHIDTYEPKRRDAFESRPSGLKGKVVENTILVPQYGGKYKIGPVSFNYFDPEQKKFVNLESKTYELTVSGPKPPAKDSLPQQEDLADQKNSENEPQAITTILPDKIIQVKEQVVDTVEDRTWIWGVLALFIFGLILFFMRKKKASNSVETASQKQLDKQFKVEINQKLNRLKSQVVQNQTTGFLSVQEELLTAIGMHYTQTDLADFTENEVAEKLRPQYGNLADEWKQLLVHCKQSKYAFGASQINLADQYKATENLWKKIQK